MTQNVSKFTPGPWGIANLGAPHFYQTNHLWAITGGACGRIAKVEGWGKEYEANARLISAAPDLLAACQEAVRLYEQGCVDRGYKDEPNWIDGVRDQLDAAIATATGE